MNGQKRRHSLPVGVLPTDVPPHSDDRTSYIRTKSTEAREIDERHRPPPPARRAKLLVDELVRLGPEEVGPVVRKLLPLGNFALEELVRSFPGPLWRPSLATDSRLPTPFELSASAAAIIAFDAEAVPYLGRLMRHPSSEVRYYAIVVSAAMSDLDLLGPLVRAVLDEDRACRRVALHVLNTYQHEAAFREAVAALRKIAADEETSLSVRRRAVSALTQLRDEASAPLFVDLLDDSDRGMATACRIGLRVLTGHDFGFSREPWLRWLAERGRQHRIQWLIEGLGDARTNIRILASRELWLLTRFLPPLTEGAGRDEFVAVRRNYERWWSRQQSDAG